MNVFFSVVTFLLIAVGLGVLLPAALLAWAVGLSFGKAVALVVAAALVLNRK